MSDTRAYLSEVWRDALQLLQDCPTPEPRAGTSPAVVVRRPRPGYRDGVDKTRTVKVAHGETRC